MSATPLWVILPVYNEATWLPQVVEEWLPVLSQVAGAFTLCLLNDGSTDQTAGVMEQLAQQYPEIKVVHKSNTGHGLTCVEGYRLAIAAGCQWIFQIDSDGQCDPQYFEKIWTNRKRQAVLYGYRSHRADGWVRFAISRAVTVVTWLATGQWIPDANVPYRLMCAERLKQCLPHIPPDFYLANVWVSAMLSQTGGIQWYPIGFRNRYGGNGTVKGWSFVKQGWKLYFQLYLAQKQFKNTGLSVKF